MMKKRKGTKQYKERLHQSGSIKELQEIVETIFADKQDENLLSQI